MACYLSFTASSGSADISGAFINLHCESFRLIWNDEKLKALDSVSGLNNLAVTFVSAAFTQGLKF